jgi:hypothetical protein
MMDVPVTPLPTKKSGDFKVVKMYKRKEGDESFDQDDIDTSVVKEHLTP